MMPDSNWEQGLGKRLVCARIWLYGTKFLRRQYKTGLVLEEMI